MTRARALKQIIRARAAKTGERYTTARRHVLDSLSGAPVHPSRPAPAPKPVPPAADSKATMSDARIRERTGHGYDYWFAELDRFGAVEKGHTAAARHLADAHGVDGWYAQAITVSYERARGARAVNQRTDGSYEVSVSKVVAADIPSVIKALSDRRRRRALERVDADLLAALAASFDAPASKGFVVRPDGLARYRYKWAGTTVQFYVTARPDGKVSIVVSNGALDNATMVEERRRQWRAALAAVARLLTA